MAPPRTRRSGFSRRAQYGLFLGYVVAVLGALIGAALLLLSTFNPPAYAWLRGATAEVTTPVASGLDAVRRFIVGIPGGVGQYLGVVSENRRMKAELEANRATMMRARALAQENARLRGLMQLRDRYAQPVVRARLVSSSASSTRRFATLNAGAWQGVRAGQPVRGPEGLIGRVTEVSPNTARVLLVVDPESIVPVKRLSDGLPAIASGRGDGLIDVRSAEITAVVFRAGDVFVTSGTGGIFPPNIPVARVLATAKDSAEARVYANPDGLDFALVMQPFLPAPVPRATPETAGSR